MRTTLTVAEAIDQYGQELKGMECFFAARDPWPGGIARIFTVGEPSNAGHIMYIHSGPDTCGLRGDEIIDLEVEG